MKNGIEYLDRNMQAKMRNSLSDLKWYAFRLCQFHGIPAIPRSAFDEIKVKYMRGQQIPNDLVLICRWAEKIEKANAETAGDLFYECWKFLHNNFDHKLQQDAISAHSARIGRE